MSTALRFSRIEDGQQAQLLQAVHKILTEVGAHNAGIYDAAYWDWQYRQLPGGKALVYGAWNGAGKLVGYYHVPMYRCRIGAEEKLIANVQDVAVDPAYRGQGLFRQLAEYANAELDTSGADLVYTFPNQKSIRTFLKYTGYQLVTAVPAYIRPVNTGRILAKRIKLAGLEKLAGLAVDAAVGLFSRRFRGQRGSVVRITRISDEVEAVFGAFGEQFRNRLVRDKAWLDWRYLRSVRGKHHLFGLEQGGKTTAVVVLKEDEMLGNPALLIMDMACLPGHEKALLYLIDQVRRNPKLTGFRFDLIFAMGIAPCFAQLGRIGFLRIPEKLNPRVLNLVVRNITLADGGQLQEARNWLLTLGDWDVF